MSQYFHKQSEAKPRNSNYISILHQMALHLTYGVKQQL